jgi:hypothetical protein
VALPSVSSASSASMAGHASTPADDAPALPRPRALHEASSPEPGCCERLRTMPVHLLYQRIPQPRPPPITPKHTLLYLLFVTIATRIAA